MNEQKNPSRLSMRKRLSWLKLFWLSVLVVLVLVVTSWVLYLKLRPKFIDVQACLVWEGMLQNGRCLKSVRFTIDRDDVWARNKTTEPYPGYFDALDVRLVTGDASAMWHPNDKQAVRVEVYESVDHVYDTHASFTGLDATRRFARPETQDLRVIYEVAKIEGKPLSGSSYLVQSNGSKNVWMRCANLSFGADSMGGCSVSYRLSDKILLRYPMRRAHLYRWREVNALILKLLAEKVTIHSAQVLSAGTVPAIRVSAPSASAPQ